MAKTLDELVQAVEAMESLLLAVKETHVAAQAQLQADIQAAAATRNDRCAPHVTVYVQAKEVSTAKAVGPGDAYAAKRAEYDTAIRARNDARKELGRD